jgi:hypothetical protein
LLLINFIDNGSNPLIRRDAFLEVGPFDESLLTSPDWDMWLRLATRYSFICVPAPQILYRFSPNSVSSNILGLEQSCLQILHRNFATASPELSALQPLSFSNFYLYLTLRALEVSGSRRSSFSAARYLWQAIQYDQTLLQRRGHLIRLALTKLCLQIVLSPMLVRKQMIAFKSLRSRFRSRFSNLTAK